MLLLENVLSSDEEKTSKWFNNTSSFQGLLVLLFLQIGDGNPRGKLRPVSTQSHVFHYFATLIPEDTHAWFTPLTNIWTLKRLPIFVKDLRELNGLLIGSRRSSHIITSTGATPTKPKLTFNLFVFFTWLFWAAYAYKNATCTSL